MPLQCPAAHLLCHSYPISMVMLILSTAANFLMVSLETSLPLSTRAIVGRDMPDRWANSNCDHPRRPRAETTAAPKSSRLVYFSMASHRLNQWCPHRVL